MCGKWKLSRIVLFSCFISALSAVSISASEEIPDGLPEITSWEEGNGYDSSGNQISGGWAYDTVNEAGRYVLFDENGAVRKKAEVWEDRDIEGEDFTPTEQESGTLALRAELFDGFHGEITVTVESRGAVLGKYLLNAENFYEWNLQVPSGTYRIQNVEAVDSQYVYAVEYAAEQFQVDEEGMKLLWLKVTDHKIGEVQNAEKTTDVSAQTDERMDEENKEGSHTDVKEAEDIQMIKKEYIDHENNNLKYFLIGSVLVIILTAGLMIRGRKNKYI